MERAKAVERAIYECINEGILAEYLEQNASDVINVLVKEWDWEKYTAAQVKAAEKRVAEQLQAVVAEKDAEIAALKTQISKIKPKKKQ